MQRIQALALLAECTGDHIWSEDYCRRRGVPQAWIDELADCYESSFFRDTETIYVEDGPTNQYQGVRDVDLAIRLGQFLGIDTASLQTLALTRGGLVRAIREAVEEG
ncbi:MAG: hypothetical protein D6753_03455 [Planctomycetota bacterium]|nr:MAG: hypothetical protein D6753_03455 [Planctomycetota bacterium]